MAGKTEGAKKGRKLTTGMVRVILVCMLIPYLILSGVMIYISSVHNREQIENTVNTSMENAGKAIADNIYAAIDLSRQASYDDVIRSAYETYLKTHDEDVMHREVSAYISKHYKFSKTISNAVLLFRDPMEKEYYTYSNAAGARYANIEEFKKSTAEAVRQEALTLGTRTKLTFINGHLYVVRNMVRADYQPFAALVLEVNMERMFSDLQNVVWVQSGVLSLDGETILSFPDSLEDPKREELEASLENAKNMTGDSLEGRSSVWYDRSGSRAAMLLQVNHQEFLAVCGIDNKEMVREGMTFVSAYAVIFAALIPLLVGIFYFFYTNINKPIYALRKGSDRIRKGEYGYMVEPISKNQEFSELIDTFNHMSVSLEDSFKRIYVEEIAERDATLKALQAQINPHFLNNTLEIINWKARMNGNDDVSDMITSLSVMMNATLNRNNEMFVPLQEELSYVDAYLCIIRQRFGSRFSFSQDVDQTLLDRTVPRLIIQPIIENAVEHGGDRQGQRTGELIIREEAGTLLITVKNNGEMTEEDKQKIALLLRQEDPDSRSLQYPDRQSLDRQSIGIRNVHLRLRMIYGGDSGLTIESDGNGMTVSTIRITKGTSPDPAASQEQTNPDK